MKLKDKIGKPKYVEYDPTRVRQGDESTSKSYWYSTDNERKSKKLIREWIKK